MKYKGMNENTIRKMLQSNETALLQKGVTDMLNTITNTTDSLLSSFSIEKFFSNKNFSDLSAFVKDILSNTKNIAEKAYNANISNSALEKSITDYMKQININTKKTSESVNKISTETNNKQELSDIDKQAQNITDGIMGSISAFKEIYNEPLKVIKEETLNGFKTITLPMTKFFAGLKNSGIEKFNKSFPLLSKVISNLSTDYTEEQTKEEEKQRSLKQNKLAEEQVGWLQGSLMPWLKKFGEEQRLESDGFIATFFPMLASMINASPLLLKLIGFGKLFLGIAGGIFGAVKFIEGIGKAVDVLGHEIDFTSLHGWLEALNLGLGNIVSSITGIDLKTVYHWLHNFDRTLGNAYKRYLQPIIGSLWKTIKSTLESAYNNVVKPIVDSVNDYFTTFNEKFPALSQAIDDIYGYFKNNIIPFITNFTVEFAKSMGRTISSIFGSNNDDETDWDDFLDTLLSPIETISTAVTELMKYAATVYQMFTRSEGITDFFNPDKWRETFEAVSESSYFSGNQYADEIKKLNEYNRNYIQQIGDYKNEEKKYENMSLTDFGISSETYTKYRNIWDNLIKEKLSKDEAETLDRITKNYDLTAQLSTSQMYARDKQIMEEFKKSRMTGIEATISGFRKSIEENEQKIQEFNTMNERDKFIDAQVNRRGISRQEALKQWNRLQERKNGIESVKESNQLEEQNIMNASSQAEMKAEEIKPAQSNIDASGSGNIITTNNYNTTNTNGSAINGLDQLKSAPQNM